MKRVGILSMQDVPNYGSFLQAYALKQIIERLVACECSFLSVKEGEHLFKNREIQQSPFYERLRHMVKNVFVLGLPFMIQAKRKSQEYYACFSNHKYLLPTAEDSTHFDLVVIGSDEVFNCCQPSSWGFSEQLFGKIDDVENVISYAGSFGHTTLDDINQFNISQRITESMLRMRALSVRDQHSANIVKQLTGKDPEIHVDPVIAYGYKDEIISFDSCPLTKEYMVVYSYGGRITDKNEIRAIKRYAKRHNLKIVAIMGYYPWCDVLVSPSDPFEVLRWFKFASAVVTDTFHGTIFSVITHRPFGTLIRPTNKNKLTSLLATLSLNYQEVPTPDKLCEIIDRSVDYDVVEEIIEKYRTETNSYLLSNLV